MRVERSFGAGINRIIPSPGGELHDASTPGQDRTGQTLAALVVDADHVAVAYVTRRGIVGIDADRLTPFNLRFARQGAVVELAVKLGHRLVGDQMQPVADILCSKPLAWLQPDRMA